MKRRHGKQDDDVNAAEGAPSEADGTDVLAELAEKLAEAESSLQEHKDRYQRTLADQENARKRHQRELAEYREYAVSGFARELLAVVDNLRRALDGAPAEQKDDPLVQGVAMVLLQLEQSLANHGVTPIAAVGNPFDPRFHEAIGHDEQADAEPGSVTQELVKGYRIGERLLRPSMVRVARRPGPPGDAPKNESAE